MKELEQIQKHLESIVEEMATTNINRGLKPMVFEGWLHQLRNCSEILKQEIQNLQPVPVSANLNSKEE